ncbi:MAG TPA: bis-aminopropyl spermidine synthase family protein [Pyrinomonadaceae bacterium]|jgi:predicted methyltransferase|nr:bis-aminopropyl spermidine synthase family protein [Pyrinomonadaceae bacterium]
MPEQKEIDLRAAINAISDVIENRPRSLREFDQIYMKAGDMVLQSELVARWADGKRLAFIGDGDAISICVAYLQKREIVSYGPSEIVVFDFDERICSAVARFADKEAITNLSSVLYNCLDPFPGPADFDCFYTNPPWGASNEGESVKVFMQRGMEAVAYDGEGMVVIADDPELEWPKRVLANVQAFAISKNFFVQKMMSQLHSYHLDDAPNLRSCNLIFKSLPGPKDIPESLPISDPAQVNHFYGRDNPPRVRYVREKKRLDYGKAHEDEYSLELLEAE